LASNSDASIVFFGTKVDLAFSMQLKLFSLPNGEGGCIVMMLQSTVTVPLVAIGTSSPGLVVTGSSIPRLKPNPLLILLKNGISHNILILPPGGEKVKKFYQRIF
jgi:hypothetical protein